MTEHKYPCFRCSGRGTIADSTCSRCCGTGKQNSVQVPSEFDRQFRYDKDDIDLDSIMQQGRSPDRRKREE